MGSVRRDAGKYGPAYSLNLPFRITALLTIMSHAGDWFEGRRQDCFNIPDSLTPEKYQTRYVRCKYLARKKRLGADTQGNNAMDIGEMEGRCLDRLPPGGVLWMPGGRSEGEALGV